MTRNTRRSPKNVRQARTDRRFLRAIERMSVVGDRKREVSAITAARMALRTHQEAVCW